MNPRGRVTRGSAGQPFRRGTPALPGCRNIKSLLLELGVKEGRQHFAAERQNAAEQQRAINDVGSAGVDL